MGDLDRTFYLNDSPGVDFIAFYDRPMQLGAMALWALFSISQLCGLTIVIDVTHLFTHRIFNTERYSSCLRIKFDYHWQTSIRTINWLFSSGLLVWATLYKRACVFVCVRVCVCVCVHFQCVSCRRQSSALAALMAACTITISRGSASCEIQLIAHYQSSY